MNRREFLELIAKAGVTASLSGCHALGDKNASGLYELSKFGQARVLHITDTHAQLMPVYFREPSVNLGLGSAKGKSPHRVGKNLLSELTEVNPMLSHAFTYLDFTEAAQRYGKVGGFSHLATLIER